MNEVKPFDVTALAVLTSLSAHVLSLAVPLALLQTYDRILPNAAYGTTVVLAIGVAIAICLEALLRYGRATLFAYVGAAVESKTTLRLVEHLGQAKSKAVHAMGTPSLLDALRAVTQVRDFWSGNAATALHELPFVAIYIGLIAYIGSWLAVIPLGLMIVALIAALLVTRTDRRAVADMEAADASCRDLTWGIFGGIVEVKALAAEAMLTQRYRDALIRSSDANARVDNNMAVIRENGAMLGQIATVGVVAFGAFMVVAGQMTTGGLAACTLLAGRSIAPAMGAFAYLSRLSHRKIAEKKIDDVLSLPLGPLWAGRGDQIFQGGAMTISGEALKGGSVSVEPGRIVLVEASDQLAATAALETIAQLDDSLGLEITLNGVDASAYDCQSLRQKIAMVSAHPELIRGSLLDNMTLFSPQYNTDALKLMQHLGLDAFVDGLHQGIMTEIGPASTEMVTPGIALRIGLIRALVRRPEILCLDEVGGAFDLDGMHRLVGILKEFKGRITIFVVSSNPELVELADQKIHIDWKVRTSEAA